MVTNEQVAPKVLFHICRVSAHLAGAEQSGPAPARQLNMFLSLKPASSRINFKGTYLRLLLCLNLSIGISVLLYLHKNA